MASALGFACAPCVLASRARGAVKGCVSDTVSRSLHAEARAWSTAASTFTGMRTLPTPTTRLRFSNTGCRGLTRRAVSMVASASPSTSSKTKTRVRFAPSPTGNLHVGGARTALYNWLLAQKEDGTFLIRVEDTDTARSTRESEETVLGDLEWLGLAWDEGPRVGGDVGPYRQSERGDLYSEYAKKLMDEGLAYPCFCTEEELQRKREEDEAAGRPPQYDGTWRDADPETVSAKLDAGEPYTVRFRVPDGSRVVIDDAVRGKVAWDANATVGDFILLRSTGVPVYNFCVAVDDALMGITTVIRAEEHLTNTLRQVLILRALGFPVPRYAHCSLILGEDRSKLSKRHGATSVTQFKHEGFLPVAMINYLATLGWNDGTEKEIFTLDELIEAFDVNRITKSPAVFDINKLRWVNGQHLRALPSEELQPLVVDHWVRTDTFKESAMVVGTPLAEKALSIVQNALELVADSEKEMRSIFSYPLEETLAGETAAALVEEGGGFKEIAQAVLADYDAGTLPIGSDGDEHAGLWKKWVKATGKATGRKGKALFHPLRLALTGKMSGPDVGEILQLLHFIKESDAAPECVPLADRIDRLRAAVDG